MVEARGEGSSGTQPVAAELWRVHSCGALTVDVLVVSQVRGGSAEPPYAPSVRLGARHLVGIVTWREYYFGTGFIPRSRGVVSRCPPARAQRGKWEDPMEWRGRVQSR